MVHSNYWSQSKAQVGTVTQIRFQPDGFISDASPENIYLRQAPEPDTGSRKRRPIWDMTFNSLNSPRIARRNRSGFTLAEVLAALLLMAIVIPVALQGLRVASTGGEVGQRKMIAARIGNKVLNELKVTGQLQNTGQSGVVQDHGMNYAGLSRTKRWTEDTFSQMILATVTVTFHGPGQELRRSLEHAGGAYAAVIEFHDLDPNLLMSTPFHGRMQSPEALTGAFPALCPNRFLPIEEGRGLRLRLGGAGSRASR